MNLTHQSHSDPVIGRKIRRRSAAVHVTHNSGQIEWFTPPKFIEAARTVMGGIDLDPASCAAANAIVKAARFYSAEDDGLAHDWSGRVWINPPYAGGLIEPFTAKLVRHVVARDVDAAIVLTNNCTDTQWFRPMVDVADAFCFTAGRIRFHTPTGEPAKTPLQGQVFLYFGPDPACFKARFQAFGWVR